MSFKFPKLFVAAMFVLLCCGAAFSQSDASNRAPGSPDDDQKKDQPKSFREMMAKARAAREKKEYDEMLKRGDEALKLSRQLEVSFEQHSTMTDQDRVRLDALEKTIQKIRKGLGGDDDDSASPADEDEEVDPSDLKQAFEYLKDTTTRLVDELKKTTRYSISVVAIQSSNSVLRIVRFLRLRK